jgi:formylmethanofuran dehydrogenase subunit E
MSDTGDQPGDSNVGDRPERTAGDRVEELTERVEALEQTIADQQFVISMLTVYADLTPLDPAACPECGESALSKRSGLTWSKALCKNCGADWVLDR